MNLSRPHSLALEEGEGIEAPLIQKPFTLAELSRKLAAMLTGAPPAAGG